MALKASFPGELAGASSLLDSQGSRGAAFRHRQRQHQRRARGGVVSAGPSWNTANLPCKGHFAGMRRRGRNQQRSTPIVSLFGKKTAKKATRETVVPDPDYRLPIAILGISGVFAYADNLLAAAPVGLLGLLLLFQTTRVRFVFDDDALEVKVGNQLQESGENVFVGGKNRWKYSTFVNWELWWPQFPILVYFKETQTKPEGQIHFFPVIFVRPLVNQKLSSSILTYWV